MLQTKVRAWEEDALGTDADVRCSLTVHVEGLTHEHPGNHHHSHHYHLDHYSCSQVLNLLPAKLKRHYQRHSFFSALLQSGRKNFSRKSHQ